MVNLVSGSGLEFHWEELVSINPNIITLANLTMVKCVKPYDTVNNVSQMSQAFLGQEDEDECCGKVVTGNYIWLLCHTSS